jgi:hypothetical protein
MTMDLKRATPMALQKEFKERYTNKDDVAKKCVRFFVHAVKDAGIELSPRIVNATRERRKPTTARAKKRIENGDSEGNGDNGKKDNHKPYVSSGEKTNYQMLIDILSPDMEEAEQDAVWTLIRYLKKAETGV